MTCKDCIHNDLCFDNGTHFIRYVKGEDKENAETKCPFKHFKNKADFVEVPCRCEKCKYKRTHTCAITGIKTFFCDYGVNPVAVEPTHFCGYGERK